MSISRRHQVIKGFTIVEVAVALLLLGGMLGLVLPAVSSLSGAYMRKTAGQLMGVIRDTYAKTALSGHSHRVVFDLETSTWWIEKTQGGVVMKREKFTLDKDGFAKLAPIDERTEGISTDTDDIQDKEKLALFQPQGWGPVDGEFGKPQKLHPDIHIHQVWVEHLEEHAKKGQVAIHFFPGGYVEEAHVTISDDELGEDSFTVLTHPLTGETSLAREIPRLPF
ncbi:MAG: hypothetical protein GY822_18950 [Deltaproteobacteria bacterium]|nr:hypothetical protein [Deltaproteobacteria bacterium]